MTYVIALIVVGIMAFMLIGDQITDWRKAGLSRGEKKSIKELQQRVQVAERGLRKIANGLSGAPELDAQNALEDMYKDTKEIG